MIKRVSPYIFLLLSIVCISCYEIPKDRVEGLWQLEKVEIDGFERKVNPTLLKLDENNSFAVSRTSGDFLGVYKLRSDELHLVSEGDKWYTIDWKVSFVNNQMVLKGIPYGYGNTYLTFSAINELPDLSEFEAKIIGKWRLYKVRENGDMRRLTDTWFHLDSLGNYQIKGPEGQENGLAMIDARHQKITFVNHEVQWSAWFYGDELRLTNLAQRLEYSLCR